MDHWWDERSIKHTRKEHVCWLCNSRIPVKSPAILRSGTIDEKWVNAYECHFCTRMIGLLEKHSVELDWEQISESYHLPIVGDLESPDGGVILSVDLEDNTVSFAARDGLRYHSIEETLELAEKRIKEVTG